MAKSKLQWYWNRLRAMNPAEVLWRVQQKLEQKREFKRFGNYDCADMAIPVSDELFWSEQLRGSDPIRLVDGFYPDPLPLSLDVTDGTHDDITPQLIAGFDYAEFTHDWHAGFQTPNKWPLQWSYALDYKQRDDIGDARTNWELNRNFAFPAIARRIYISAKRGETEKVEAALNQFNSLFNSWVVGNPFLWGIAWTSVMEVAIRAIQWMLSLAYLKLASQSLKSSTPELTDQLNALQKEIAVGSFNMVCYICRHYSRYSSANNHLLVEMCAVWLAGKCFGIQQWINLASDILNKELPRQNSADGVNLESSLHYHVFVMEAYLLVMQAMLKTDTTVPTSWIEMIKKMAKFLQCSMISHSNAIEFGDNDQGCIIYPEGGHENYYRHILRLATMVTGTDFTSPQQESVTFSDGGYTFLRSTDGKTVIGIDHAPLGFGSIAAHGHADAMSIQLCHNGLPIITDAGTSLYHCDLPTRNKVRDEMHHSTIIRQGKPQSEMLGAFLWGKRAKTRLLESSLTLSQQRVVMETTTCGGAHLRRAVVFDPASASLAIEDLTDGKNDTISFIIAPDVDVIIDNDGRGVTIGNDWHLSAPDHIIDLQNIDVWPQYGCQRATKAVRLMPVHAPLSVITIQRTTTPLHQ